MPHYGPVNTASSPNQRRASRHPFGGVAEFVLPQSGECGVGMATELGRYGCFIRTEQLAAQGTKISIRITHEASEFAALGTVAYCLPGKGMGIAFGSFSPAAQVLLAAWPDHRSG